jgi:hypothetical protein
MERKDLLLQTEAPTPPKATQSEPKLAESVDEGASYLNMLDGRGWKLLVKNFIEPRSALTRILQQPGGRARDEATAAVAELVELVKYIEGRISQGRKANEDLEKVKRNRT